MTDEEITIAKKDADEFGVLVRSMSTERGMSTALYVAALSQELGYFIASRFARGTIQHVHGLAMALRLVTSAAFADTKELVSEQSKPLAQRMN